MKPRLTLKMLADIHLAIDALFDKAKVKILGPQSVPKKIKVSFNYDLNLPSIFYNAAKEEYNKGDGELLKSLLKIAESYIDSTRETVKAKAVNAIQSFLTQAEISGVKTDVGIVLGGELTKIWKETTESMYRILNTEANRVKNISTIDAISKINAANGVDDPIIYFSTPLDKDTCEECLRLHFLPDEMTPRAWYLSELKSGYAKRGDNSPSTLGQHPHCRAAIAGIGIGFGFKSGRIAYISPDYNEIKKQRG